MIAAELLGVRFEAVFLGGTSYGLVECGSAEVEQDGHHWHVNANVLGEDGFCHQHTMPDSFTSQSEAEELAASLNAGARRCDA